MATKIPIGIEITAYDRATSVVLGTVNRITGATGRLARGTIGAVRSVVTSTAAQVAALGAGFLSGQAFTEWIGKTGELKDFAAQIGVSAEALQEWRFAASQAGVDGETLDKSLAFLSKNMGQLQRNAGPLYTFLGKVAPKALASLKDATPEQALERMIRLMEAETDEAKRAALATAAFGKSGAAMARLAIEGSDGLAKLRAEARSLGIVMSQAQVDAVEAFGDSVDKMKASIAGAGYAVGNQLIPVLSPMVDEITRWATANREVIAQRIGEVIKGLVEGVKALAGWWGRNAETIKGLASGALKILRDTTQFLVDNWTTIATIIETIARVWIGQKLIAGLLQAAALSKTLAGNLAAAGAAGAGGGAAAAGGAAAGAGGAAAAGGAGALGRGIVGRVAGALGPAVAAAAAAYFAERGIEETAAAIREQASVREAATNVAGTDIAARVMRGERAAGALLPGELEQIRVALANREGWSSDQLKRSQARDTFEAAQFADEVLAYIDRVGRREGLSNRDLSGFQAPGGTVAAPMEVRVTLDLENAPGVKARAKVTGKQIEPRVVIRGIRAAGVL